MGYKIHHLSKEEIPVNKWSGGTTSELWIWPPESSYSNRTFSCRISTATVELLESDFTILEGYERQIMSLDKPLKLKHGTEDWVNLAPFEVHTFNGGAMTKSEGSVKDFNLMTSGQYKGVLSHVAVARQEVQIRASLDAFVTLIYCVEGNLKLRVEDESKTFAMTQGACFIIEAEDVFESVKPLILQSETGAKLAVVTVNL